MSDAEARRRRSRTREAGSQPGQSVAVTHVPDYSAGNPYQDNLVGALGDHGDDAALGSDDGRLPLLRAARDADVLHLHWLNGYLYGASGLGTLVATALTALQLVAVRALGVPVVWTVHNTLSHDTPNPRLERVFRWFLATFISARIIVHCAAATDEIAAEYGLSDRVIDKVRVIRHGHYIDDYDGLGTVERAAARERFGLPATATVYLAFGMIRPYKQVPELIETFRSVATADDVLVVAGDPSRPWLEDAVRDRAGDDDRVRTDLRRIPDDDVAEYFAAADVVVTPYRDVLTSGSAVLALSAARPVIAPYTGCLPCQVGGAGILYPPTRDDELGKALAEARDRPLDAMGAHGHRQVSRNDWDVVAARTHDVYAEVVAHG